MAAHEEHAEVARDKRARALDKIKGQRIDRAIADLATSIEGRELLWWLLTIGKIGAQPFTSNALTTAFQCGELNVGQQFLARILEVDPAIYVRMMQEQQNEYQAIVESPVGTGGRGNTGPGPGPGPDDDASSAPGNFDHPDL